MVVTDLHFIFIIAVINSGAVDEVLTSPASSSSWEEEACSPENLKGQSQYRCNNGRIQCLDGWIGDLCQVPQCGEDCDPQHGYCTQPGECTCNLGYTGEGCRECMKLPGCKHGDCSKSFECACEEGWSGMFCNAPECPSSCDPRRGSCLTPNVCTCKTGYQGDDCSSCATREGCKHGSCKKPGECLCEEGWKGRLCDKPICAPGCRGVCKRPGECQCEVGWKGAGCDSCVVYPGCANGNCSQPWQCNCQEGWSGVLCDAPTWTEGWRGGVCTPVGSFLCMNGGTEICSFWGNGSLVGAPRCECLPGFSGTWCESLVNNTQEEKTLVNTQDESPEISGTVLLGTSNQTQGEEREADIILTSTEIIHLSDSSEAGLLAEDPGTTSAAPPTIPEKFVINQTPKLSNTLEWVANPERYTGSGRRTS